MLILEDDAIFTYKRGKSRFAVGTSAPRLGNPLSWILRSRREDVCGTPARNSLFTWILWTLRFSCRLLENSPIAGPVDVWLADNEWFGLPVCYAAIANEGWRRDDGTYEGANLVDQARKGRKVTLLSRRKALPDGSNGA